MINPMDMAGRRIMVTGASSGLGRATAIHLSQLGARLVLVARNRERLEETHCQLVGDGHYITERDLGSDIDTIPHWMKQVSQTTGPLHGVVHSAGIVSMMPLRVLSLAKVNELMEVNFSSALMVTKGFRQRGVVASPASVVFISSIAGLIGQRGLSAYCASKGALIAIARSLALELAEEQIRINCVAPGLVETEMADRHEEDLPDESFSLLRKSHPLGFGRPDDIANVVAFLLADTGRWITGTTVVVDGGYLANGV